ncbi:MAG: DUF5659 domain-containing protein [Cetobacterium sp.]
MKECFKIFSLKLANCLVKEGFEIIDYEINTKNPRLKVFVFKDSDEFRNTITKLTSK